MIPLKLTVQGLYSYSSRQEIDFAKLTHDGLFGIFGNVGSGKSTILEAISFALYEESERLNNKENRNYNMMNLKSNELYIDFEFRSHSDTVYRFEVKGKRNSKRFDEVKAFDRKAYQNKEGQWEPIDPKTIEEITGLNYKNFRRTIIIPQGRFQEFLQLNPSDRTTMLKELFNLSRFELSDKVGRLESKNNASSQRVRGQLEEVGEVDPDRLEALTTIILDLKKQIEELKEKLEQSRLKDAELDQLKLLTQRIFEQQQLLSVLEARSGAMESLNREVKEFEKMSLLFHADLEQLKVTEASLQSGETELAEKKEKLVALQQKSEQLSKAYSTLKVAYDERETLLQEAEEIRKYQSIRESKEKVTEQLNRLSKGNSVLQETVNKIAMTKSSVKEQESKLNNLKADQPDLKVLSEIREWFSGKKSLQVSQQELQTKQQEGGRQMGRLSSEVVTITMDEKLGLQTKYDGLASFSALLKELDAQKNSITHQFNLLNEEQLKLDVQKRLGQYASELEEGVPCPLCGAKHHPEPLNPKDVSNHLEQLVLKKKALEARLSYCQTREKQLNELQFQIASFERQQNQYLEELKSLAARLEEHSQSFRWKGFEQMTEDQIRAEFDRYDLIHNDIISTEKVIREALSEIEKEESHREKYAQALVSIEKEIGEQRSKIELLTSQIKLILLSEVDTKSDRELAAMVQQKVGRHAEVTRRYLEMNQALTDLSAEIYRLSGVIESLRKSNLQFADQQKQLHAKIAVKLERTPGMTLSDVVALLSKEMDIEASKQTVADFFKEKESLKKLVAELQHHLKGRSYEQAEHLAIKQQVSEQAASVELQIQALGKSENELTQLKINVKRASALKAELSKLELRGQDISELKNLFRASSFVSFVSTIYLQNLCKAANARFYQLTRHQLGLELKEDNSFQVRDYMNEGRLRSAKTLSGGQTFQASLSLALSLADSIHQIAGSAENFFFLDEGFGTLDKESLEVVFESLKALRKENRIVGVISHVEEMQQEIGAYLKVVNTEEKGSQIIPSWEV